MTVTLPPLSSLTSAPALLSFLSLLLEPTPILSSLLVPQLLALFSNPGAEPTDYGDVLRKAEGVVQTWEKEDTRVFVEGHPRIGEGDVLSELSKKEQSGGVGGPPTSQATLDRLAELNALYERNYPGLRYITFVAGRPRAAIAIEMEELLGSGAGAAAEPDAGEETGKGKEPAAGAGEVYEQGSEQWEGELDRAVGDVWKIGRARLEGLTRDKGQ